MAAPARPPAAPGNLLERGSVRRPVVRGTKARTRLAAMTASPLPGGDNATAVLDLYGMADHRPAWINKVPCLTRTRCGGERLLNQQRGAGATRHADHQGAAPLAGLAGEPHRHREGCKCH